MPHHVFLSYSRRDTPMMERVRDDLRAAGLLVWTDENLKPGTESWQKAIQIAIEETRCLVVILSPDAKKSEWVERELIYARAQRKRVFPMLARGDDADAVPFELIRTQYVDIRTDYVLGIGLLIESVCVHVGVESPQQRRQREMAEVLQKAEADERERRERERLAEEIEKRRKAEEQIRLKAEAEERERKAQEQARLNTEETEQQFQAQEYARLKAKEEDDLRRSRERLVRIAEEAKNRQEAEAYARQKAEEDEKRRKAQPPPPQRSISRNDDFDFDVARDDDFTFDDDDDVYFDDDASANAMFDDVDELPKQENLESHPPQTNIPSLTPWNPIDQFRLLGWLLVNPARYTAYEIGAGKEKVESVKAALINSLLWFPLFIILPGYTFLDLPLPTIMNGLSSLAWTVAAFGVWLILRLFRVGGNNLIAGVIAGMLFGTAVGVAFGGGRAGIALGAANIVVYMFALVVASLRSERAEENSKYPLVILIVTLIVASAVAVFLASGMANIAVIVIVVIALFFLQAFIGMLSVNVLEKSLQSGQASLLSGIFLGTLAASFAVIIWIAWLGGWHVFGGS